MTKVSTNERGAGAAELEALGQRLKGWRTTREGGERIPKELWRAATDLARIYGLSRTATALKLGYCDLRRRLQAGDAHGSGRSPSPVFVEVPAMPLPSSGGEHGSVELVAVSGARLILRVPEVGSAELLQVVEVFLRPGT